MAALTGGTTQDDGDEGDEPTAAVYATDLQAAQRTVLLDAARTIRGRDDRERGAEYDPHITRQLFFDESRKGAHERAALLPAQSPGTPDGPPRITAAGHVAAPPAVPQPPTGFEKLERSVTLAESLGFTGSIGTPTAPEFDHRSAEPPPSGPQPGAPASASQTSADLDTSARQGWRDLFLDSLGGIPVPEMTAPNLSALGREAEAVLAHLADLGQEWTGGVEWSEGLWLAAGVLLVGGGVHYTRAARQARAVPEPPPPADPEDTP
ncbi:MAG: hypothetical protein J0I06_09200 [Planctomycetes bacterium]|nr:hypothetical protein [Planctomycetota bacterium]